MKQKEKRKVKYILNSRDQNTIMKDKGRRHGEQSSVNGECKMINGICHHQVYNSENIKV